MSTIQTDNTETALPLELTINVVPGGGLTGLTPTVALRLTATGTPSYLDFATNTFKTSGWTTKYQTMSEIERGHYQYLANISALGLAVGTKLSAEYHFDSGTGLTGDGQDIVVINNTAAQVTFLRKVAKNRLEETSGNPGTLVLYDDDGATPLETWSLRDETGGAVNPATGTPAKRSAATP
jgi:hypothetical protein